MTESKAEHRLHEEFDALKEDFSKLRGDVADLVSALHGLGTEKVGDARESLNDELEKRREKLREALMGVKSQGEKTAETVEHEIARHPLASVLAAFGLGYVVAKLMGGRH